jgi:hypothetical protein
MTNHQHQETRTMNATTEQQLALLNAQKECFDAIIHDSELKEFSQIDESQFGDL